jgi:hypothetical protein
VSAEEGLQGGLEGWSPASRLRDLGGPSDAALAGRSPHLLGLGVGLGLGLGLTLLMLTPPPRPSLRVHTTNPDLGKRAQKTDLPYIACDVCMLTMEQVPGREGGREGECGGSGNRDLRKGR